MKNNLKRGLLWLGMAMVMVQSALGYVYLSSQASWLPGYIPMKVKVGITPVLSDGSHYSSSAQAGMQTWNSQLEAVQFYAQTEPVGGQVDYENDIYFDSTIEGDAFGSGVLAVTLIYTTPSIRQIFEADIIFNNAYTWDSYSGPLREAEDFRRVATHELGHVLGLSHPDEQGQSVEALMNSHASDLDHLTADDITGAQSFYLAPGQNYPPGNNNFANATTITHSSGSLQVNGQSFYATKEVGEPDHDPGAGAGGASVWWKWTAPVNGNMTITTQYSHFDTLMGVYTGSAVDGLNALGTNDDVDPSVIRYSSVAFNAAAGTTYSIAVDGWDGESGIIVLNLAFTPEVVTVAPSFTSHPANRTVPEGAVVQFSALASGTPSPYYQWQRLPVGLGIWLNLSDGGYWSGTATPTLSAYTNLAMTGDQFRCVASNSAGNTTSNAAVLTVNPAPPAITLQPQSQTRNVGEAVAFVVTVSGTPPLTYRWQKDGVDINGALGTEYNIASIVPGDVGAYRMIATNSAGTATSNAATLTVNPPPVITTQPLSHTAAMGTATSFSVSVNSQVPLTYQWQVKDYYYNPDWTDIMVDNYRYTGSNTPELTIVSSFNVLNGSEFRCVVSSAYGNVVSAAATITFIIPPPVINTQPHSLTVIEGTPVNLSVYAVSYGSSALYQWRKNGQDIPGATNSSHVLPAAQFADQGSYQVAVSNTVGTSISDIAVVTVLPSTPVVAVSAAYYHSVFIRDDGTLWGAGNTTWMGPVYGDQDFPVFIADHVVKAAAGYTHTVYVKEDGTLWYAGRILAPGSEGRYAEALPIATGVTDVSAGFGTTYFIKTDGTLWSFGTNTMAELGDGTTTYRSSPVQVATGVRAVAGGASRMFFIKTDDSLWAVGSNQFGALGDGTLDSRTLPVQVATAVDSVVTNTNSDIAAFIKHDGTLWVMGAVGLLLPDIGNGSHATPIQLAADVVAADVGYQYVIYAHADGTLWARGNNYAGQLGDGTFEIRRTAVQVASSVTMVTAGVNHSLFITTDGSLWGMGNGSAFIDSANGYLPVPVLVVSGPLSVPATPGQLLAIPGPDFAGVQLEWASIPGASGYEIWRGTVGDSASAVQIGTAGFIPIYRDATAVTGTSYYYWVRAQNATGTSGFSPVAMGTPSVIAAPIISTHPISRTVAVGATISLSVVATGVPAPTFQWQRLPVGLTEWENVQATPWPGYSGVNSSTLIMWTSATVFSHSGDQFRCVVTNSAGSATSNAAILTVAMDSAPVGVAGGYAFSLFRRADGSLWGMGGNVQGQLGDGTGNSKSAPGFSLSGVADMAAGAFHTLLLKGDATLWSSGLNTYGALGTGDVLDHVVPQTVASGVAGVSAGVYHSLFVKQNGTLWSMGWNTNGQIGNGAASESVTQPVQMANHVLMAAAGYVHSIFVKLDGTVWAAGYGGFGQFGNGSPSSSTVPMQVGTGMIAVASGYYHTLFLGKDGSLWTSGTNAQGQLGDGTNTDRTARVQIATSVVQIAAALNHSLFLKADGTLWAMGDNSSGQLGDGSTTNRATPVQIATNVTSVSTGFFHTLFVKADGSLWGMGSNGNSQLGGASSTIPVEIARGGFTGPAQPGSLSATNSALLANVRLTWTPATGASHYEVWRGPTDDPGIAVKLAGYLRSTLYEDSTGNAGVLYYYWVRALQPDGQFMISDPALGLQGAIGPLITAHPQPQTVNAGSGYTFTVEAVGTGPLLYQWRKDGVNLPGAVSANYANTATVEQAGSYDVVVSNTAGTVTSNAAVLTVNQLTQTITFEALPNRPFSSAPVLLNAVATSSLPVSFSVLSGPANLTGNQLTLTGVGPVAVRASQAGDASYGAAPDVDRSFNVTPSFASWCLAHFTGDELNNAAISGPNADPDGDGHANLVEYALGLEPRTSSTTGLPEVTADATHWIYTYTRPEGRTDVACTVEVSTDLSGWGAPTVAEVLVSASDGVETWQAKQPLSSASAFFRLKVSQ